MLGLFNQLDISSLGSIILVSFIIGSISSIHCVGMCGGIMLATSKSSKDNYIYQIGRLISYILLTLIISSFSKRVLEFYFHSIYISFVTILIGVIFLLFGFKKLNIFRLELKFKLLQNVYNNLLKISLKFENCVLKSLFIGMASIFLPCGALYLFSLSLLSMIKLEYALLGIFFFWLPTSIVLISSNQIIKYIVNKKAPIQFQGAFYIFLGVITILYRVYLWQNFEKFCS